MGSGGLVEEPCGSDEPPPPRKRAADRTRGHDYLAMAASYVAAAQCLASLAENESAPFHMLVAHSLELSLKAILAHDGRDEEWLMMTGHDLDHCHREARLIGFSGQADRELSDLVRTLDRPHADQRFRYPVLFGNNPRLVASDTVQALRLHLTDVGAWLSVARR